MSESEHTFVPDPQTAARWATALAAAVAPIRVRHGTLLKDLSTWALAAGIGVERTTLAVVLGAAERRRVAEGADPLHWWTRPEVNGFLWADVHNWWSTAGSVTPHDAPAAIWIYLGVLAERGLLAAGSDSIDHLREPLICYGGLGFDGRKRPRGEPAPLPCQCYLEVRPVSTPGNAWWNTAGDHLIELWRPCPADPAPASWWRPLVRFSRAAVFRAGLPEVTEAVQYLHPGEEPALPDWADDRDPEWPDRDEPDPEPGSVVRLHR